MIGRKKYRFNLNDDTFRGRSHLSLSSLILCSFYHVLTRNSTRPGSYFFTGIIILLCRMTAVADDGVQRAGETPGSLREFSRHTRVTHRSSFGFATYT